MSRTKMGILGLSIISASLIGAPTDIAFGLDDWPQWMGPKRDNIWRETGLVDKFPKDGPKVVWRTKIAGGYSGPAVQDGKVFITDYQTNDNVKVDNFVERLSMEKKRIICLENPRAKKFGSMNTIALIPSPIQEGHDALPS